MLTLTTILAGQAAASGADPDHGQKTAQNCLCKTSCGYNLLDGGVWDWCYTQNSCGRYSLASLSYWDYCVYPENNQYEAQTAAAKHAGLWKTISQNATGGTWPNVLGLLTAVSVKTTMEDIADFMPAQRTKYIHSVGSVGQVVWTASTGHPYTGIFASGSNTALIRFSTAKPIEKDSIVPGFAIKFLRDGVHSGNFVAMPSLDGQSDFNFFALNFTNHPAKPTGWALQLVAKKFTEASNCPLQVGLSDVARYGTDGKVVNPNFPYKVIFVPSGQVKFPSTYYDDAGIGRLMGAIPVGTRLFSVVAFDSPASDKANKGTVIGTVSTASKFVKSSYGDARLFFKHTYMESDFKLRPTWLSQIIDKNQACGTNNVGPEPPYPFPTSH